MKFQTAQIGVCESGHEHEKDLTVCEPSRYFIGITLILANDRTLLTLVSWDPIFILADRIQGQFWDSKNWLPGQSNKFPFFCKNYENSFGF